ncbi:MAG: putative 2OG-Fe(II) oxygenase [Candidatus Neomarinimicrobiota bacterium]|jgi:uncharacterized protein (TIGR02466 family)|nr:putative 2OG-Fe(II) oxygenase [Candidatus Neomarinimicrobiota bacterium]|tara:strand:- start:414 stop:1058 length:645 start_codon:yes stop_codon:yes gene_type:complete
MEENSLQLQTPFGYVFGKDYVKEDLSELRTNSLFAEGLDQKQYASSFGENPFHILDKYQYSKKIISQYFHKFIRAFYGCDVEFKLTTSWAVKLRKGEAVHHHNHKNCLWSGLFYYGDYTEKSCPLYFRNPIIDSIPLCVEPNQRNPMISDIAIPPETNMIIFFPSWIYHWSYDNQEHTRYSLAFNFMPSGQIGGGDSSYSPSMMLDVKKSKGFG